ncbi:hypothetical protein V2J09_012290 [Rumex salicifolius]
MAMQSNGAAAKHGVIQSSIALLQERFRQLQREKEMRETRQLFSSNNTTTFISSSPSPSSSSDDSEPENHHRKVYNKLLFCHEVQRPELSLSLWPSETSYAASGDGGRRGVTISPAVFNGARSELEDYYYKLYTTTTTSHGPGFSGWGPLKCDDDSRVSDVDTSLHL